MQGSIAKLHIVQGLKSEISTFPNERPHFFNNNNKIELMHSVAEESRSTDGHNINRQFSSPNVTKSAIFIRNVIEFFENNANNQFQNGFSASSSSLKSAQNHNIRRNATNRMSQSTAQNTLTFSNIEQLARDLQGFLSGKPQSKQPRDNIYQNLGNLCEAKAPRFKKNTLFRRVSTNAVKPNLARMRNVVILYRLNKQPRT